MLDVVNGVVSIESAKEDYGLIIDPETKEMAGLTGERKAFGEKITQRRETT